MIKTMIAAMDVNRIIGINGTIGWHYPEDFKRFKMVTSGGTLIMGSKTWLDVIQLSKAPKFKILPGRNIIIVSSQKHAKLMPVVNEGDDLAQRFEVAKNTDTALNRAEKIGKPIFIAGGGQIYSSMIDDVDVIDITIVPELVLEPLTDPVSITYFPKIPDNKFWVIEKSINELDNRLTHYRYTKADTV